MGNSLAVQWLVLHAFTANSPGSAPGRGTKIPQAAQQGQKKKEIMDENFPNLKKETDIQAQEGQRVPNKMNPNRSIPRHN